MTRIKKRKKRFVHLWTVADNANFAQHNHQLSAVAHFSQFKYENRI